VRTDEYQVEAISYREGLAISDEIATLTLAMTGVLLSVIKRVWDI